MFFFVLNVPCKTNTNVNDFDDNDIKLSHLPMSRSLHKKCPYSELFWSVFCRFRTECGEILRISPYSVRMRENADQNTPNTDNFHAVDGNKNILFLK